MSLVVSFYPKNDIGCVADHYHYVSQEFISF